ncbi:PilZ domain-containing protein [Myxococcota bacterium]|nr:PilZ domain-containing protein [Myxococcota bacterium]MBU1534998.1 PilZ domain-containing protein [Myxococcota bacterium]
MMFQERRYARYQYQAPVLYKTDRFTLWKAGTILDISLGGILLSGDVLPSEGETLNIRIANLIEGTLIMLQ